MSATTTVLLIALIVVYLASRSRRPPSPGRRDARKPTTVTRDRGRCPTGKVPFPTQSDADQVVRRSQTGDRDRYDRPLDRSYRCPHCGSWQTTSQRKRASW
jgi:hypothetical protein